MVGAVRRRLCGSDGPGCVALGRRGRNVRGRGIGGRFGLRGVPGGLVRGCLWPRCRTKAGRSAPRSFAGTCGGDRRGRPRTATANGEEIEWHGTTVFVP